MSGFTVSGGTLTPLTSTAGPAGATPSASSSPSDSCAGEAEARGAASPARARLRLRSVRQVVPVGGDVADAIALVPEDAEPLETAFLIGGIYYRAEVDRGRPGRVNCGSRWGPEIGSAESSWSIRVEEDFESVLADVRPVVGIGAVELQESVLPDPTTRLPDESLT